MGSGAAQVNNREVQKGGGRLHQGGTGVRLRQSCPRRSSAARTESGPCLVRTVKGRAGYVTSQCQFLGL